MYIEEVYSMSGGWYDYKVSCSNGLSVHFRCPREIAKTTTERLVRTNTICTPSLR